MITDNRSNKTPGDEWLGRQLIAAGWFFGVATLCFAFLSWGFDQQQWLYEGELTETDSTTEDRK